MEDSAKDEAFSELENKGFVFDASENEFTGIISCGDYGDFNVTLHLPENFPYAIPLIFAERKSVDKRIPHLEFNRKLCLVPNTGILIDASKPRNIINESLERACEIIQKGLSEENREDFLTEYLAYWKARESVLSICSANDESREILVANITKNEDTETFIADNFDSARSWTAKTGYKIANRETAFFLQLNEAFYPPDFKKPVLHFEIIDLIKSLSSPESYGKLNTWLWKRGLPATLILSLPVNKLGEKVLIGVRFEKLTGELADRAQEGFRPGLVPAFKEILISQKETVTKIEVNRLDADYLLPRGGANNHLLDKTVTVMGCGAIGSHLAIKLASLGIGNLRMIDNETLEAENIHRHALGMTDIGKNKAQGITELLNQKYPHLNIEYKASRIQDILKENPDYVLESDIALIALGDETLELFLNDSMPDNFKRLHVWVEPLGIGGHLLSTGLKESGCYRCLFEDDSGNGISNQAAFAASGQIFQRSFSGCAGVFTPFSAVDADRAANEAATLTARILLDKEENNMLVSWRGYEDDFINAGFKLSRRGRMFSANEKRIETTFANQACSYCGKI